MSRLRNFQGAEPLNPPYQTSRPGSPPHQAIRRDPDLGAINATHQDRSPNQSQPQFNQPSAMLKVATFAGAEADDESPNHRATGGQHGGASASTWPSSMNMAWKPKRKGPFQSPVVQASNTPKGDSRTRPSPARNVSRMAMKRTRKPTLKGGAYASSRRSKRLLDVSF